MHVSDKIKDYKEVEVDKYWPYLSRGILSFRQSYFDMVHGMHWENLMDSWQNINRKLLRLITINT